ncbi:uncharacterized protein n4bp2l2 [Polymixia lowei]
MSHGDLAGTASRSGQNHCVKGSLKRNESPQGRRESAHMDTKQMSVSGSPAKTVRERVLKDVGSTSTIFIGPECRPKTLAVKRNIEDTLSEFYKELENIDSTDGTHHTPGEGSGSKPLKKSKRKEICNTNPDTNCPIVRSLDTGASQERHSPRPHWYQNEPYHPGRQRPSIDSISGAHNRNHSQHLPPFQRPPYPRFHRPPNCGPPPPFSYAFPRPPDSGPHMNHYWNRSDTTSQYQDDLRFPPMHRFPPPDEYSLTSQDFDGHSPHHFDRNRWGYNHDNESSHVDVQWSSSANNRWSQLGNTAELQEEEDQRYLSHKAHVCDSSLALILMRGLPGSGKSTKAQELLSTGPNGLVLSTDDYFAQENGYLYDPSLVGVAHECNQRRAKEAMRNSRSPVIIDNTNIQAWEMKPYVKMALENGYRIYFHEPDTRWKFDPFELEKRNKHGVPQEKIAQMLDRFSFPISVDIVMSSQEPEHVNMRQQAEQQGSRTNNPDCR